LSKAVTEPKKNVGSWAVLVLDIVLIVAASLCIRAAWLNYTVYDYYTDSISTLGTNSEGQGIMNFNINFTATVFSAQNPITVHIIATLSPEFQQKYPNFTEDTFYFYLKGAVPPSPTYNMYGGENVSVILLHRQTDGTYQGGDTITFNYEGDKCFTGDFHPLIDVTALCTSKGNNTEESLIHISSADSLFQLKTQHTTLALTWAFGAFAVILARDFAIGAGNNFVALVKEKKEDASNNSKSKKAKT
jgi:hypothetical protein